MSEQRSVLTDSLGRKRKREEEECTESAEEGTSKVPNTETPVRKRKKKAQGQEKVTKTDSLGRKRKREEEEDCTESAEEGTSKVPNTEAPVRKRKKKAQGQEKVTKTDSPGRKRKREEEECTESAEEGTSKVPNTEAPVRKRKKGAENQPQKKSQGQKKVTKTDPFSSRYEVGEKLGEGGFGTVFKGRRIFDGLQVAIKFVVKRPSDQYLRSPYESKIVPSEVALLQIMNRPPVSKHIVRLIEWFDQPKKYIMIMERPDPCMELEQYIEAIGDDMDEEKARAIMLQAVEAARQCSRRGVLHRDIKAENFLINTDTSEIKLIDFGCGDLINKNGYNGYAGTIQFCPPEFFLRGRYHANPATVWSLGVLLFRMVCGYLPFEEEKEIVAGLLELEDHLSEECCNLIDWCLQRSPYRRPSLRQIKQHVWLQCAVQA